MTFDEFRQSRKWSANLAKDTGFELDGGGYLYAEYLYIEQVDHENGKYMLVLENMDWLSDNLEYLECRLYLYGVDAGFFSA